MNITLSLLRSLDACAEPRNAFAAAFPDGLTVTDKPDADAITKIVGAKLNVDWLCVRVLTKPAYDEAIAIVDAAYRKAVAPAYAAYRKAVAPADADYRKAVATAYAAYRKTDAAYRKAIEAADAAYGEAIAPTYSAYRKAIAPADAAYGEALTTVAWRFLADDGKIKPEYRGLS